MDTCTLLKWPGKEILVCYGRDLELVYYRTPMDCHLNKVGTFEFSRTRGTMPSVVFDYFHQGYLYGYSGNVKEETQSN